MISPICPLSGNNWKASWRSAAALSSSTILLLPVKRIPRDRLGYSFGFSRIPRLLRNFVLAEYDVLLANAVPTDTDRT